MIETSFTVNIVTDEKEDAKELIGEIRRLLKDSYFNFEITDLEQEEI